MEFKVEPVDLNLNEDPSSQSIKLRDNLSIERDKKILNPLTKMNVNNDSPYQGEEIVYMELLDPSTEMIVDDLGYQREEIVYTELLDSAERCRPITELDQDHPLNVVWDWNDSHIVNEELDCENYSQSPKSSESNLDRVLIKIEVDIEINGKSKYLNCNENPPMNREGNLKGVFNFPEEIKEQKKPFSRNTRKGSESLWSINDDSPSSKRIEGNLEPSVDVNVESVNLEPSVDVNVESVNLEPSVDVNAESEPQSVIALCEDYNNTVHKLKSTYCNKSGTIFRSKKGSNKHKKLKPFKCRKPSCDFVCNEKKTLSKHKLYVHGKLKLHNCSICDLAFDSFVSLSIHTRTVHEKRKPFKCLECIYSSNTKSNLVQHIKLVHEKKKPFKCLECNGSFSQKHHLLHHIKSVHEKIKPFKCLECNHSFSQKFLLLQHIKSVHEKIKPFKCLECNYLFSQKGSLLLHTKSVHMKLKPFKCLECNNSFSQKHHLLRHKMSVHDKIKPVKCLKCNYSCCQKCDLVSHMNSVHDKIKPFKCFKCNFPFSRKDNLVAHMKSVHKEVKPFRPKC